MFEVRQGAIICATLILSPHLDDAVISAWTDLHGAIVANVCTAAPAPGVLGYFDRTKGVSDSATLMALRHEEDRAALQLAGVAARLELGFLDAQYRDGALEAEAVRAALPAADAILAPAALGGHPDHVAARDAALAFAREEGVPASLYADLPYATRVGWPAWVTDAAARPHLVPEAWWELDLASAPLPAGALRPRVVLLNGPERGAKERALRTYVTQFEVLNAGPINRLLNPAVLGFEVRWDVSLA